MLDLETGESRLLSGHTNVVVGIDVSRDGRFIAPASDDTTVRLWDIASGVEVRVFRGLRTALSDKLDFSILFLWGNLS